MTSRSDDEPHCSLIMLEFINEEIIPHAWPEADLREGAPGPRNFSYFFFFFLYSGKLGKHNIEAIINQFAKQRSRKEFI